MNDKSTILIVEDDEFKLRSLKGWVSSFLPEYSIDTKQSVSDTVNHLENATYDYILLDMALPARELKVGKGPTESLLSGGLEVLLELSYRDRRDKVIVVTQYPEIEIDGQLVTLKAAAKLLKEGYYSGVLDCIYYEHNKLYWQERLGGIFS